MELQTTAVHVFQSIIRYCTFARDTPCFLWLPGVLVLKERVREPPTRNTIRPNTELLSPLQKNYVMVVVGRRGNESWSTGQYATLPTIFV